MDENLQKKTVNFRKKKQLIKLLQTNTKSRAWAGTANSKFLTSNLIQGPATLEQWYHIISFVFCDKFYLNPLFIFI